MNIVTFVLGAEEYGIELSKVQEIIRVPLKRSKLPNTAQYNLGIANLRGNIIPVIDLKNILYNKETEFTDESRLIVLESNAVKLGVVVDEVLEVMQFSQEEVVSPDSIGSVEDSDNVRGIVKHGERLLILLDVDKLMQKYDKRSRLL